MNTQMKAIAEDCLAASYSGSMTFPDIVGRLVEAGFEGYLVDYRRGTTTYYLPGGDGVVLENEPTPGSAAAAFSSEGVGAAVREAQENAPGYTYKGFCAKAKGHGCAGYLVSFPGRRVVYFGRTAETHVEHFPGQ